MKKKIGVGVVVWALSVLMSLLIFFVVFEERSGLRVSGLVFILISLTIALGVYISVDYVGRRGERVMYNAGMYSVTGLYVLATVLVSVIFMSIDKGGKWLGLIDGILIILFAIMLVLMYYMSNVMGERNRKTLRAIASVKSLESEILTLKNNPNNSKFAQKLEKLYEAAKYCDCTVYNDTDQKISLKISQLKDMLTQLTSDNGSEESAQIRPSEQEINANIDEMLLMYKTRREEVKLSKQGGF